MPLTDKLPQYYAPAPVVQVAYDGAGNRTVQFVEESSENGSRTISTPGPIQKMIVPPEWKKSEVAAGRGYCGAFSNPKKTERCDNSH